MLTSAIAVGAVCVMGKGIKERHPAVKSGKGMNWGGVKIGV